MIQTKEQNRVKAVNIVFLVVTLVSVATSFLPLDFLAERPVLNVIFSQSIILIPSVVYMCVYRIPYRKAVGFRKMRLGDIGLSLLFGILIQPALTLINALSMVFASNTTSDFLIDMTLKIPFVGALFFIAVVPAILEETLCRGVFFQEYRKVDFWKGALLSGFLFGLMHGNLNQFCYATVLGIVFALLVEATGSILSTMMVHFWTNAGSVIMMYLYPKLYETAKQFYNMYVEYGNTAMVKQLELVFGDMSLTGDQWMRQTLAASAQMSLTVPEVLSLYGPVAVMAGVLAFFVFKKLAKRNGTWDRLRYRVPQQGRLLTIPLVVAIVIGVAYMIFYEVMVGAAR